MNARTKTIREALLEVIDKVPRSINRGGHQAAVTYKSWVVKARAAAKNQRVTDQELNGYLNQWHTLNKDKA